jgi:hypothetical protein
MRFLFNPVTNQLNAAPPRDTIYAATAPVNPPFGTRWANTQTLREYLYINGQWVEVGVGPAGKQGDKGDAATVAVGTTTTGAAGTSAAVANSGTTSAAVLNFTVPKGDTGTAATVAVGTTTTGAAGTNAAVSNSGTTSAAVLNFTIPQGVKGDAATLAVGTTTTGAAGTNAAVSNSGTTSAAVLNFTVPKGDTGTAATIAVGTTTTGAAGTNAAVSNSGTTSAAVLNFTIPQGIQGVAGKDGTSVVLKGAVATFSALPAANRTQGDLWVVSDTGDGYVWSGTAWTNTGPIRGPQGPLATISVGQTVTGAAGTSALVENTGTASAAVLKFTVPQGVKGDKGDKGDTGGQGPAGPAPAGTGAVVVSNGLLATPVAYGSTNTVSSLVQRDASGNFSAGTITASLTGSSTSCTGNAATATKLETARNVNVSGDLTGTAQTFDGGANLTIPVQITAGVIVDADINATAAIADTKLATISTSGKVLNSATTAASANTVSAIVARDALGNFSAGTITADLTGTATSATTAGKLTTARSINGVSFDGSSDITIGTPLPYDLLTRLSDESQDNLTSNWDNATQQGFYTGLNASNSPPAQNNNTSWIGFVQGHNSSWLRQTLYSHLDLNGPSNSSNAVYVRHRNHSNGWTPWAIMRLTEAQQDARYSQLGHTHTEITNLLPRVHENNAVSSGFTGVTGSHTHIFPVSNANIINLRFAVTLTGSDQSSIIYFRVGSSTANLTSYVSSGARFNGNSVANFSAENGYIASSNSATDFVSFNATFIKYGTTNRYSMYAWGAYATSGFFVGSCMFELANFDRITAFREDGSTFSYSVRASCIVL